MKVYRELFTWLLMNNFLTLCNCETSEYAFQFTKEEIFGSGKMIEKRIVSTNFA